MAENKFVDHYALLGLSFNAEKEQIEKSYQKASLQTNTSSTYQGLLDMAYDILSDDDKRKTYDENYVQQQMGEDVSEESQETGGEVAEYIQEDADNIMTLTNERYEEFDAFVKQHLGNKDATLEFKARTADKAEELYKQGMWPLLGKLKALVGEASSIYNSACEIHAKAVFSLGDICMWATHYERAVGMYNTALALSANNKELAARCAKAIELAKIAFEESKLLLSASAAPPPIVAAAKRASLYLPYTSIALYVLLGFFFAMICLWSALILLDVLLIV